ncbi:MAG: hypothetical protein FJW23_12875 [Acidimicrobiia bacterium]|nr:hypothetical protein [Acidimicrobiia bacterium]
MTARRPGPGRALLCAAAVVAGSAWLVADQRSSRGDNVAPAYEGWENNPDGSFSLVFGYMNRNWEEHLHVPVGPDNSIEPGGPDQGQPTFFFPRRNRFVFKIRVPADFGEKELVWTITANGRTERAYGTLKRDYYLDNQVIMMNFGRATGDNDLFENNKPPELAIRTAPTLQAKVGVPIMLTAVSSDDAWPKPRDLPPVNPENPSGIAQAASMGLRVAWHVYRGNGTQVTIDPPQFKIYEDTRWGSPWAPGWVRPPVPDDNTWSVRATFAEAGTYVLRCLAHDGVLQNYEEITVEVRD